ncbi:MAG: ribosome-binding factor A [Candidatus Riflebacteria bacterium]|nr:ribosome-binding factor A [Candidatus Riflebacteria bacterium]
MKSSHKWENKARSKRAEYLFDDGIDSRNGKTPKQISKLAMHDRGLCSQVYEVLSMIFSGASEDERLWNLGLLSVDPSPDSSRLSVKVYPLPGGSIYTVSEICALLKSARPYLRREIGESICRARIPELIFVVLPGPEEITDYEE